LEWFFQFDLAPPIGYCAKCIIREVMGVLFFGNGLFVIISVGNLLGNLAVLLLVWSHPNVHGAARWAVCFGVFGCALVLWYLVGTHVWVIVSSVDGRDPLS
jgi:hypothetical protein